MHALNFYRFLLLRDRIRPVVGVWRPEVIDYVRTKWLEPLRDVCSILSLIILIVFISRCPRAGGERLAARIHHDARRATAEGEDQHAHQARLPAAEPRTDGASLHGLAHRPRSAAGSPRLGVLPPRRARAAAHPCRSGPPCSHHSVKHSSIRYHREPVFIFFICLMMTTLLGSTIDRHDHHRALRSSYAFGPVAALAALRCFTS